MQTEKEQDRNETLSAVDVLLTGSVCEKAFKIGSDGQSMIRQIPTWTPQS